MSNDAGCLAAPQAQHTGTHHHSAGLQRRYERRVVGHAQVAAEPQQYNARQALGRAGRQRGQRGQQRRRMHLLWPARGAHRLPIRSRVARHCARTRRRRRRQTRCLAPRLALRLKGGWSPAFVSRRVPQALRVQGKHYMARLSWAQRNIAIKVCWDVKASLLQARQS